MIDIYSVMRFLKKTKHNLTDKKDIFGPGFQQQNWSSISENFYP